MAAAVLELRERAARDPLTGLDHHAMFYKALPALRSAADRCALLLADVDGFKAINDTRGHAAGDDVLRALAGLLRAATLTGGGAFPDRRATSSRSCSSARARRRSAGSCARRRATGSARPCRSGSRWRMPARATRPSWRAPTRRSTRSSAAAGTG
jgi:hypothetical protein